MSAPDAYHALGTIRQRKLYMANQAAWDAAMRTFPDGEDVIVSIRPGSDKGLRSLQQNALQWALFTEIAQETGHTKEEIHDYCCARFLEYAVEMIDPQTGECDRIITSRGTSRLSIAEHTKFLEDVRFWAQTFLGMELPA